MSIFRRTPSRLADFPDEMLLSELRRRLQESPRAKHQAGVLELRKAGMAAGHPGRVTLPPETASRAE